MFVAAVVVVVDEVAINLINRPAHAREDVKRVKDEIAIDCDRIWIVK